MAWCTEYERRPYTSVCGSYADVVIQQDIRVNIMRLDIFMKKRYNQYNLYEDIQKIDFNSIDHKIDRTVQRKIGKIKHR